MLRVALLAALFLSACAPHGTLVEISLRDVQTHEPIPGAHVDMTNRPVDSGPPLPFGLNTVGLRIAKGTTNELGLARFRAERDAFKLTVELTKPRRIWYALPDTSASQRGTPSWNAIANGGTWTPLKAESPPDAPALECRADWRSN